MYHAKHMTREKYNGQENFKICDVF